MRRRLVKNVIMVLCGIAILIAASFYLEHYGLPGQRPPSNGARQTNDAPADSGQ